MSTTLAGWTHAGIVVKYRGAEPALLVEATLEGIEAFPLPARIRHYQTIGAEVAARQLTAPMNTATEATLQVSRRTQVLRVSRRRSDVHCRVSVSCLGGALRLHVEYVLPLRICREAKSNSSGGGNR